ncbi:MAG: hypothetical protein ACXW6J_15480 [Candidatus Binatia bacterium]
MSFWIVASVSIEIMRRADHDELDCQANLARLFVRGIEMNLVGRKVSGLPLSCPPLGFGATNYWRFLFGRTEC